MNAGGAGPAVSVLLPFRNAGQTLAPALDSLSAQTLRDYEVLAVDDGSSDGSTSLVAARAARDGRIRLLPNPGSGLVDALNHGLAAARSELVARFDADDLMEPERLALQREHLLAHPQSVVLGSRVRLFPQDSAGAGYREYVRWQNGCVSAADIAAEIYVESPFAHPSVMYRRSVVLQAGAYRDGDFPEDYELWLRLFRRGVRMEKLPQVLLAWRDHPGRASRTDPRYARRAFDLLRLGFLGEDPRLRAAARRIVCWGAGRRTRQRLRPLFQRGYAPRAWIDVDPRKIGNRIDGVAVRPPQWLAERSPRPFVLGCVTSRGAHGSIAAALDGMGYRRGRDYLLVG